MRRYVQSPPGPPGPPGQKGERGDPGHSYQNARSQQRFGTEISEPVDYSNVAIKVTDYIKSEYSIIQVNQVHAPHHHYIHNEAIKVTEIFVSERNIHTYNASKE